MHMSEFDCSEKLEIPCKGAFRCVKVGFSTEDADSCWIALHSDGTLETNDHSWSGREFRYGMGFHRYRVDEDNVKKLVELLSSPDIKLTKVEQDRIKTYGTVKYHTVETSIGMFRFCEMPRDGLDRNDLDAHAEKGSDRISKFLDELFKSSRAGCIDD